MLQVQAQESGPAYIKSILKSEGVFDTPLYTLTSDYVDYSLYDNIQGLFIDALDYEGDSSKVFCWYGVPDTLQDGDKAPAVVLVHGGGGTAFPEWVHQWTERGYIAIAIAHEGQLPGEKVDGWYQTWEYSGPRRAGFFRDADEEVGNQWFYHAVADAILANSLLRSFTEVDTTNIGINGVSWGGVLNNVITGIDQRYDFSIPVYGCGYLYNSPKYSVDMASNTDAELEFYYANWEPSLYIPLQNLPVFYVNGSKDKQFALNIATPSYNLISSEKYLRIKNPMTHSTAVAYSTQEVYEFADYVTQSGTAPVKVSIVSLDTTNVVASFQGSVESAVLCYTSDSMDWAYTDILWNEKQAEVVSDVSQITAEIPDSTQYFFINVYTNEGFMYSSPMEKALFVSEPSLSDSSSISETEVYIKANANTDYGIDQTATLISDVQVASDSLATFKISCGVFPASEQGIMSGPGGGTSVDTDWGIAASTDQSDIQNVIFSGSDNEWVEVGNIQIVDFNANGGELTLDGFTDIRFQSIIVVNAQSTNKDAVAFAVNGDTIDIGNGVILATQDTLNIESVTGAYSLTNFSLGTGDSPNQDKNKWSVGGIGVTYQLTSVHTLNVFSEFGSVLKIPDQMSYEDGALVKLVVVPDSGYSFFCWEGDTLGSISNVDTLTFVMDSDKEISALFITVADTTTSVLGKLESYNVLNYRISPNPSNGIFRVAVGQEIKGTYSVYSINGTKILDGFVDGSFKFDLSPYNQGVYLFKITSNLGEDARTIILNKNILY
jgi:cephalosporin-C deacetylase-like acetyl esterase